MLANGKCERIKRHPMNENAEKKPQTHTHTQNDKKKTLPIKTTP